MLESEAKTKWCPHVRAKLGGYEEENDASSTNGINRFVLGGDKAEESASHTCFKCIGSACMMWRRQHDYLGTHPDKKSYIPTGFCGLAGKP